MDNELFRRLFYIVILVVFVLFLISIGYRPAQVFFLSDNSISFTKYGGKQTIVINSSRKASSFSAEVIHDSLLWLSSVIDDELMITANPNAGPKRNAIVVVTSKSRFFGIGTPVKPHRDTIVVTQDRDSLGKLLYYRSGNGDGKLVDSYSKTDRNNGGKIKIGNSKASWSLHINTDAVKLEVSSLSDDMVVRPISDSSSFDYYHNAVYSVDVAQNDTLSRTLILQLKVADTTILISYEQLTGFASRLSLDKTFCNMPCEGGDESVGFSTDGTRTMCSILDTNNSSWLKCSVDGNKIKIHLEPNKGYYRREDITVVSQSVNGSQLTKTIFVKQAGTPVYFVVPSDTIKARFYGNDRENKRNDYSFYVSVEPGNDMPVFIDHNETSHWIHADYNDKKVTFYTDSNDDHDKYGTIVLRCGTARRSVIVKKRGRYDSGNRKSF